MPIPQDNARSRLEKLVRVSQSIISKPPETAESELRPEAGTSATAKDQEPGFSFIQRLNFCIGLELLLVPINAFHLAEKILGSSSPGPEPLALLVYTLYLLPAGLYTLQAGSIYVASARLVLWAICLCSSRKSIFAISAILLFCAALMANPGLR